MTLETSTLRRTGTAFLLLVGTLATQLNPFSRLLTPVFSAAAEISNPADTRTRSAESSGDRTYAPGVFSAKGVRRDLAGRATLSHRVIQFMSSAWRQRPGPIDSLEVRRRKAVEAVAGLADAVSSYGPELTEAFRNTTNPETRAAIGHLFTQANTDGFNRLAVLVLDHDPAVAGAALRALDDWLGAKALPEILRLEDVGALAANCLASPSTPVVIHACSILAKLGPAGHAGQSGLTAALAHESAEVRVSSISALARVAQTDPECTLVLLSCSTDSSDAVRAAVATGLGYLGTRAGAGVPFLARSVESDQTTVAFAAARALAKIGPTARASVPALARALGDSRSNAGLRAACARALGKIGPSPGPAVPALGRSLGDPDEYVRQNSAIALRAFGATAAPALNPLIGALDDVSESVRILAAEALGAIGLEATSAIPALQAARNNNQSVMSAPVLAALDRIQGRTAATDSGANSFP